MHFVIFLLRLKITYAPAPPITKKHPATCALLLSISCPHYFVIPAPRPRKNKEININRIFVKNSVILNRGQAPGNAQRAQITKMYHLGSGVKPQNDNFFVKNCSKELW